MKTKVKELRTAAKMTQQQLADLVHVSSRTIISIEKEQYSPSLMLAYRIAQVFGVTVEDFSREYGQDDLPGDIKAVVDEGKPIVGYYGYIAPWIDLELLNKAAKARPQYNFVYIGATFGVKYTSISNSVSGINPVISIFPELKAPFLKYVFPFFLNIN